VYEGETKELGDSREKPLEARGKLVARTASGQASGEKTKQEKSNGATAGAWWRCEEEERGMENLGVGIRGDGMGGVGFSRRHGLGRGLVGGGSGVLLLLVGGIGMFGMAFRIFETE